jgi:fumarate hydratase, class II
VARSLFEPVIVHNVPESCRLPGNSALSFTPRMVRKPDPDGGHIAEDRARSLVLVTTLIPRIGYDKAVKIGKPALADDITLKRAAEKLGFARSEHADRRENAAELTQPGATLPGGGD